MRPGTAKNTRITATAVAILLTIPLAACSAQGGGGDVVRHSAPDYSGVQAVEGSADSFVGEAAVSDTTRSVISTGDLTVEVEDPRGSVDQARELAKSLGGYVESQTVNDQGSGSNGASLTVRVPQEKLDEAFAGLGELGKVRSESRSSEDVTAQHVDLQARVASLETSVERLTDLMAGSATTSELIEAESALSARQAELDSLKAQLKMLEGQVDEATIWVTFTTVSALPNGGPSNFWEGLLAGLSSITAAGAGALVLLGILLPWLVVIAIVTFAIVLLVRSGRKRRARRRALQPQPVPHYMPAQEAQAWAEQAPQHFEQAAPPQAPPAE